MSAAAQTTAATRPDANVYGGRCSDCGTYVYPGTGTRRGSRRAGWSVFCADHSAPLRTAGRTAPPPSAPAATPPATAPAGDAPRPSDAAIRSALAMLAAAEADTSAPDGAVAICREIAACVAYCGGATLPAVEAEPSTDAAAVAADLLADLGLGSPTVAPAPTPADTVARAFAIVDRDDAAHRAAPAPAPAAAPIGTARRVPAPSPAPARKVAPKGDRWAALRSKGGA